MFFHRGFADIWYTENMKKYIVFFTVLTALLAAAWYSAWREQSLEAPAPTSNQIIKVLYACNGGKTIDAAYYEGTVVPPLVPGQPPVLTGSVGLKLSDGRTLTLPQTISADGVRYANSDESFIFWGKGDGALVLENNAEKNYTGCIRVAEQPFGSGLSKIYSGKNSSFSIRLPGDFTVDESHQYALGSDKSISGVKFSIPASLAKGTNLSSDSYVSVEKMSDVKNCTAGLFLGNAFSVNEMTENNVTYSFASSTGTGAGNRYEEIVYAVPGTNPCLALRYFIHYSDLKNYTSGTIKEFDRATLLKSFDRIRSTFVWNQ